MWRIDKDYISDDGDRVGVEGHKFFDFPLVENDLPTTDKLIRFRMKDDDGEIYYEGELHNDSEAKNQLMALEFGKFDAGCTTIEVKVGRKWIQEIG